MLKENDPRLEKLPKWVQSEIGVILQKLTDAEKRIAALSAGPEDTDTLVPDYSHPDIPLPSGSRVHFVFDEHNRIEAHLESHPRYGKVLQVRSSGNAGGTLVVRPNGANSLAVAVDPR